MAIAFIVLAVVECVLAWLNTSVKSECAFWVLNAVLSIVIAVKLW